MNTERVKITSSRYIHQILIVHNSKYKRSEGWYVLQSKKCDTSCQSVKSSSTTLSFNNDDWIESKIRYILKI